MRWWPTCARARYRFAKEHVKEPSMPRKDALFLALYLTIFAAEFLYFAGPALL
jgi:hypothetical protein